MEIATDQQASHLLLPNRFRLPGYLLLGVSVIAGYLYFLGGKPEFFEVPVFAILTSYFETRWFVVAQTNLLDEIAVVTGILGFFFVLFSKDSIETEHTFNARIKALLCAGYITAAAFILLYLTVFGWPILAIAAGMAPLFLAVYVTLFMKFKSAGLNGEGEKLKSVRSIKGGRYEKNKQ
ncbi:MAG: hypothetical protein JJU37_01120 [Balneolaceae bacterium]|nr:hypothetical protein [Balneolaceae bacterium]